MRVVTGVGGILLAVFAVGGRPGVDLRSIPEIQGGGHLSPLVGREIATVGVVTAVTGEGFHLQDSVGDRDPATSEGIFVATEGRGAVAVGDRVRVVATVEEGAPKGSPEGLTVTRLVRASTIDVLARGRPLPRPVIIGLGGRSIPRRIITPNGRPVDLRYPDGSRNHQFRPASDALDLLESLEWMRVTIRRPAVLSPTEGRGGGRADFFAHPDGGTVDRDRYTRTAAGGILLRSGPDNTGDQNADRLRVAFDSALSRQPAPVVAVGDRLGDVTGVLGYAYGSFQVTPVAPVTVISRSPWRPEVTRLARGRSHLTVATYNVLNLSADSSDDQQRARLASQIVRSLRGPDILALQEIQDSSGERDDGVVDGRPTLRALAAAVRRAGGPRYGYIDVPPVNGRPGGAPGGNIRNAVLYDSTRVRLVSYRALTSTVLAAAGAPDPAAFAESRDPLEAVFESNGRTITVINNHLTSRYGSTPVFGAVQPWVQAGESERQAQVQALHAYVKALLNRDGQARVVVLGDMNTFEFTDDLAGLLPGASPLLTNLISRAPEPERYSYNFEGNCQSLDHIFVSWNLAAVAEVDPVHLNTDFPSPRPASDHDPVVARFRW